MTKKVNLTRSVAVTDAAYDTLQRTSNLTGMSLGALTTLAIERAFDPKRNIAVAATIAAARQSIISAV